MSIDQLFGSFLGLSLVSSLDANSEDYVAILAHHVSIKSAHAPRSKTLCSEANAILEPWRMSGKSHAAFKSWLELMIALALPAKDEPVSKP